MTYSRYRSLSRNPEAQKEVDTQSESTGGMMFFILLHIPLAILFKQNSIFPTIHALASLGLGLFWLMNDRTPRRVILMIAYITGAELLWRGANAHVFYEFGKYAVILLLILLIMKYHVLKNASKWPIWYFLLLTPSILVMPFFDREAISFNLAGPLALAIANLFFSTQTISLDQLRNFLVAILAPAVGLGGLVFFGIVTTESINFSLGSNFQASADFGPNQVSSIIAIGALVALYFVFIEQRTLYRYLFVGISLWLLAQAALTFSRGGVWTTIGAAFTSGFYLLRDRRTRAVFVFTGIIFTVLSYFVVIPFLDGLSQNRLSARFSSMDSTGRYEIAQADLIVFQKFPLFGVGPGQSNVYHALTFRITDSHTEYTRMLAEHGSLGLLALIILAIASIERFTAKTPPLSKAFKAGMTMWALLYMIHASTRLVAPSVFFGLASANFALSQNKPQQKNIITPLGTRLR
ncbi:MAG: O-antigen ligase family protein [Chloroflexi bacterium]|nr:O-antigen ligase family protein [Chloroflexota bacterium]